MLDATFYSDGGAESGQQRPTPIPLPIWRGVDTFGGRNQRQLTTPSEKEGDPPQPSLLREGVRSDAAFYSDGERGRPTPALPA